MPKVNYTRPEVIKLLPQWKLVRDCIEGSFAVKEAGKEYLPVPDPLDTSPAAKARYDDYLLRAIFYGVTGRTMSGLIGYVFLKDPVAELDALLKPFLENADGSGVTLDQQAKDVLSYTLGEGRCGLLVDYPMTEKPATREDVLKGRVRPTVTVYSPGSIINWRTSDVNGEVKLSLVVLQEEYSDPDDDDGFEQKVKIRWRELRLKDGVYTVTVWQKKNSDAGSTGEDFDVVIPTVTPTDATGKPFTEIPFQFVGWKNNSPDPDPPPMADLAVVNIGHYRNSADYEESCFINGQATVVVSGVSSSWVKNELNGAIRLGSRSGIPLPVNAKAELLQAEPNTMPKDAMETKERQMVALGAKLVEQREVQQTATEARHRKAGEESVLSSSAKNVTSAYNQALRWAGRFLGSGDMPPDAVVYELNSDFAIHELDATQLQALVATWQSGGIDFEEFRWNVKRANIGFKDDKLVELANEAMVPRGDPAVSDNTESDEDDE